MDKINFDLFGINILTTKEEFLKKLSWYDEDEAKTDSFSFDYAEASPIADFDGQDWLIRGGGDIDSAAGLISEFDTLGKYVVEQAWGVLDCTLLEVIFVNCECHERFKKYYADGLFIWGQDGKLSEPGSDYYNKIFEAFSDGDDCYAESDIEATEFKIWPETSYAPYYFGIPLPI